MSKFTNHHSRSSNSGVMSSSSSTVVKRGADEQRKMKEDEQAAAQAFEEYVAVFQDTGASRSTNKVWIKAGTYDAGRRHEDHKEKGKLYKPTSRFVDKAPLPPPSSSSIEAERDRLSSSKKKGQEKKKSNLEIFKEELKIIQEEREERHRLKKMLGLQEVIKLPPKPGDDLRATLSLELEDVRMGSIDDGDPNTTNIYLGNLPTKITEQQLMEIFGKFGPLASVKVMWPRTDEEKARNRLSGFVAFMSRRDGERALKHLAGKEILNTEVKLGWGKAVPIPAFPIYIPPAMMQLTMPPPPSGLPFNCQTDRRDRGKQVDWPYPTITDPKAKDEFDRAVVNSTVKVVIPTDRTLIALIHRMVEFVAREGPMFEAMIMNREISNPQYRFLFENQSPAHVYYRWKLFSILQGDSTQRWRTEDFRMFNDGSIWRPPSLNPFTQGMPDELIPEEDREIRKGTLSNAQRIRMERMLRNIVPERHKVAEIMIFSIEHSEAIPEICECIKESLSNPKTPVQKKIARLYVMSDILYNCTAKHMNAVGYRKGFKTHLPAIFQELHYAYQTVCSEDTSGSPKADCFKERVMACCRAWDDWGIYPSEFHIRLQNIFLGLLSANSRDEEEKILEGLGEGDDDEDVLKKRRKSPPRAQLPPKSALNLVRLLQSSANPEEDIDGVPIAEEEVNGTASQQVEENPTPKVEPKKGGFVPSKWETVDPEEVKAGAVTTTSKWDLFEKENSSTLVEYNEEEDIDGRPMEEDSSQDNSRSVDMDEEDFENSNVADLERRRIWLREVELRVLAYQDELEKKYGVSGADKTVMDMVEEYRKRLLIQQSDKNQDIFDDDGDNEEGHKESSRTREDRRRRRRSGSASSSSRSSSKKHRSSHQSPHPRSSGSSSHSSRHKRRSPDSDEYERSRSPRHQKKHRHKR